MFEQEWDSRSLFGWEKFIPRILGEAEEQGNEDKSLNVKELFCKFCNKTFLNENVFHFHKKGKRHIKAVNSSTAQDESLDQQTAQNVTKRTEFT